MALVISDQAVIELLVSSLTKRIADLEMTADTQGMVGETDAMQATLKEWARARSALRIVEEGITS